MAGKGFGIDLLGQAVEAGRRARRQRHLDAFGGKHPRERRAEARSRAHDQRGVELHGGHRKPPNLVETSLVETSLVETAVESPLPGRRSKRHNNAKRGGERCGRLITRRTERRATFSPSRRSTR